VHPRGIVKSTGVVRLARSEGWEVRSEDVPVSSLYGADEIFLTSTAGGIMPITTLDNHSVGMGKVGPVTQRIWERYWELHADPDLSFAVDYD
jgi:branched-subunit amino acid aminotransferase/4-amino-4-deoxychorismate lyase